MPLPEIGRREFIALSLSTFGSLAFGHTENWSPDVTGRATLPPTLYDRRFPLALTLARAISSGGTLRPMNGDPTEIISDYMSREPVHDTVPQLQGITLQSVPFCLAQIQPRVPVVLHRLDHDLVYWRT